MIKFTNHFLLLLSCLSLASCSLLGIHFKVHNPKKAGKMPDFSEETILLGELTPYRSCFDVQYYDLALDIDPDKKALSGTVEIHAKAMTDFDTLQIDLDPNFEITNLTELGTVQKTPYTRNERAIFVYIPHKKDDLFILQIQYHGIPIVAKKPPWKGGFVWKKDKEKNPWIGVTCETDGASIWWPLKDHTSDEPDSMRTHYTVPKGLTAVANGQLIDSVNHENTTTFNWFVSYPINTYNVSVYVGDFKPIHDTHKSINGKDIAITHYVLKPNHDKAKAHFQQVHPILDLYEKRFGPYPWQRDGFKLIESPYAGMEHQTAIAYGNGYKNELNSETDYIILHEIAHEWWGNSVTAQDLCDVWLQEGFATYAEALYFEENDISKSYNEHLQFNKLFIKNKYPVVGVCERRWFHYKKSSDAYVKGAWVLHTLRQQLQDDQLFFDIIKTFYLDHQYDLVSTRQFIELVNEKSGDSYDWFFDQYLYNNFAPILEYDHNDKGELFYRWTRVNPDFDKLQVTIAGNNGTIIITPSTTIKKVKWPANNSGIWSYRFQHNILCGFEENKKLIEEYHKSGK